MAIRHLIGSIPVGAGTSNPPRAKPQEEDVSKLSKTLFVAATAALLATPSLAQQATPWEVQEGKAHVVDMEGKTKIMQPKGKTMEALKKRAKPVPKGTIFFMNNGQLYQSQGSKDLFDDF
jgi:hypothetical protein